MRPNQDKASQSDRLIDLDKLWEELREDPPGGIRDLRPVEKDSKVQKELKEGRKSG